MALRNVRVNPLAAESFGVRSMCTYVETPDVKILLDGGVSLGPNRFGFPPHPKEYRAVRECRKRVAEAAERASIVTISHFHHDHYTPSFTDYRCNHSDRDVSRQIYQDKLVLTKNFRKDINFSQRRRGWFFQKTTEKHAEKIKFADGKTFGFGDTYLRFSDPVPHGPEHSMLGWVLMATIESRGEKVLFASDVQGPMATKTLQMILEEQPDLLIVGGPPLYLADFNVEEADIKKGMKNLTTIVSKVPETILEHHLLRDIKWREYSKPLFDAAEKAGHRLMTASEYGGKPNNLLELRRQELYDKEPPSAEFEKWMKLPRDVQRTTKPPIG